MTRRRCAFTLIELLVVNAIVAILVGSFVALAQPRFGELVRELVVMNVGLAVFNLLPFPPEVHRAWKLHYDNIRHSLYNGFYQSWDLHPAQIPARLVAVYTFFLESLADASARLSNFREQSEQATRVGAIFDDAATGRGLVNFFERAVRCGSNRDRSRASAA